MAVALDQRPTIASMNVRIPDIHCCECAWILQLGIEAFHGVDDADVDRESERATITFRPAEVSPAEIVHAIESAGYRVSYEHEGPVSMPEA